MQYCDESGSTMNGLPSCACLRTGSDVTAFLRVLKAFSSASPQVIEEPFLGEPRWRSVRGRALSANFLIYRRYWFARPLKARTSVIVSGVC